MQCDECSIIDIKIVEKLAENEKGAGNKCFQRSIESIEKRSRVEINITKLRDEILLLMRCYFMMQFMSKFQIILKMKCYREMFMPCI